MRATRESKSVWSKKSGVGYFTMNHHENLNAIDLEMSAELLDGLSQLDEDEDVKVVVLNSASPVFSSGGDLQYDYHLIHSGGSIDFSELIENVGRLALKIEQMKK